jgi:hypothetical protein
VTLCHTDVKDAECYLCASAIFRQNSESCNQGRDYTARVKSVWRNLSKLKRRGCFRRRDAVEQFQSDCVIKQPRRSLAGNLRSSAGELNCSTRIRAQELLHRLRPFCIEPAQDRLFNLVLDGSLEWNCGSNSGACWLQNSSEFSLDFGWLTTTN